MSTAAEDRAAITAAIQVAADNDKIRFDTFMKTNLQTFSTLSDNLGKLSGQLSNPDHADRLANIQTAIDQALGDFNTVLSLNNIAQNPEE